MRDLILLAAVVMATFTACGDRRHTTDEHSNHQEEGHGHGHGDAHGHGDQHEHGHEEEGDATHTDIPEKVARDSGVRTETASSQLITSVVKTRGKVLPAEDKIAHIIPRFSGVVREGRKHIGDRVDKGEVLAIVESNQSLQPFEVRSQIAGTVVHGHLIVGEFVPENQWVYIVADLSQLWVDLFVPIRENAEIQKGQKVMIVSVDGVRAKEGTIAYVAPYADERSQSRLVRIVLANEDNGFVPGMFVTGDIVTSSNRVDVAIRRSAVQSLGDEQVVFAKVGDSYEARSLLLGRTDGNWVEVIKGLSPGEDYVTQNAFLIKADILKAGAAHEH